MDKIDGNHFAQKHPFTGFFFFLCAIIGCFALNSPVFLSVSFVTATVFKLQVSGLKKTLKTFLLALPTVLFIAIVNPLFNHNGNTPFLYINDIPLTVESLVYGLLTGLMLFSSLLWFSNMNSVLNGDKLNYLIGKILPTASLLVSMIFKSINQLKNELGKITMVQKSFGVCTESGTTKERMKSGSAILSSLTSNALEKSVDTAISMRSRGFGLAKRTFFKRQKFTKSDGYLIFVFLVLITAVIALFLTADFQFQVFPEISKLKFDTLNVLTYIIYGAFLLTPTLFNIKEEIRWRNIISKI